MIIILMLETYYAKRITISMILCTLFQHDCAVPVLSCDAPVSSNGVITVTWSYIHTGGLPLTNLFLTYTHLFLGSNFTYNNINDISVSNINTTSVIVSDLIAGAEYTFNITAENNIGSSSIICGPTSHVIGEICTRHM